MWHTHIRKKRPSRLGLSVLMQLPNAFADYRPLCSAAVEMLWQAQFPQECEVGLRWRVCRAHTTHELPCISAMQQSHEDNGASALSRYWISGCYSPQPFLCCWFFFSFCSVWFA